VTRRQRRAAPRPLVAVVGLGLVGGSLARALSGQGYRVIGVDRPAVLAQARRAKAISGSATVPAALRTADLLVLAAPPSVNRRLLARIAAARPRAGVVVTDVGSVKGPIVDDARRLRLDAFVGGHPMAGTEKQGFAASREDLFRGCRWILTPAGGRRVPRVLRRLIRDVGARAVIVSSEDHDRAVAFLSHAAQLVSCAVLEAARQDPVTRRHLDLAGPGFRDMTRLAKSPRGLWREIVRENAVEVERALAGIRAALHRR
jgi:prephenate dehydrogenase